MSPNSRKAFIVRPFGTKCGNHFDEVQRQLIEPALTACGIDGGTSHMRTVALQHGAAIVTVSITDLLKANPVVDKAKA